MGDAILLRNIFLLSPDIEKIQNLISQISASKDASPQTTLVKAEEIIKLSTENNYDIGLTAGHFFKDTDS